MAATDVQAIYIARQQGFQDRCQEAITKSALVVKAEANTVTGHALRETYADKVLAGTCSFFEVAVAVMCNATIQAEADITQTSASGYGIPDSDIEFQTTSIFSALAGVAN